MNPYRSLFSIKRLSLILAVGMIVCFGILLFIGWQIYQVVPPIPEAIVSTSGETLFTRSDIETGQNVGQSIGGMEQGSIWNIASIIFLLTISGALMAFYVGQLDVWRNDMFPDDGITKPDTAGTPVITTRSFNHWVSTLSLPV